MSAESQPRIGVIVLAYNEEETIVEALERTRLTLQKSDWSFEILVVDDGSADRTPDLLNQMQARIPELRILRHPRNMGIGKATHTGFTHARGEWIIYLCSDLQFAPEDILDFLKHTTETDVIVGTRPRRADSAWRKLVSWGYHRLMRRLFGIRVTDTNWIQAYRGKLVESMSLETSDSQILTEMLMKSAAMGARIVEIPTRHFPRTRGTAKGASPSYILKIFLEILGLWWRTRGWKPASAPVERRVG